VMRWMAGQRLRPDARARSEQEQQSQKCSGPGMYGAIQHFL
jgi:hypothetical protein